MRRKVLWILGTMVGLVAVIVAWGAMIPRDHAASSAIDLRAAPESVWVAVRDVGGVPAWWPELESSTRRADSAGREVWEQKMSGFEMALVVTEDEPPRRLVTVIDAPPDAVFGGSWTYEVIPQQSGTRVRVTEHGWIGNPVFRVATRFTGFHGTLDQYLVALGRRFGETVVPEHVTPPQRIEP